MELETKSKFWEGMDNFGRMLVPSRFRPNLRKYVTTAGYTTIYYSFFTILFIFGILVASSSFFYFGIWGLMENISIVVRLFLSFFYFLFSIVAMSAILMGGVYFSLNMTIYNRTKEIEDKLIDFLVLVSTNLKGGLSFEKSLWSSIKPEFTILSEEMSLVSKKVMTGSNLNDALVEFSLKYDSPSLQRSINIIVGELDTGGKVTKVLDSIIENLRKTKIIKDEMAANTLMFTIFIAAIVLVISPLLFALAFNLLDILIGVSSLLGNVGEQTSSLGFGDFSIEEIEVDPRYFRNFSIAALVVISLFSSMIISIIQKGDIKAGIKYLPFFAGISALLYLIFLNALSGAFSFV